MPESCQITPKLLRYLKANAVTPSAYSTLFESREISSVQLFHGKQSQFHLWELFSGSAHLTELAVKSGLHVLQLLDL